MQRASELRALQQLHGQLAEALEQGDLVPNVDFRGVYSSVLEDWLGLDATPIVGGKFDKLPFVESIGAAA